MAEKRAARDAYGVPLFSDESEEEDEDEDEGEGEDVSKKVK